MIPRAPALINAATDVDTSAPTAKPGPRVGLAYLHVMETTDRELTADLRRRFGGTFILNPATPGAVTSIDALALVEDGTADMISFASLFLAIPDLPWATSRPKPHTEPQRPDRQHHGRGSWHDRKNCPGTRLTHSNRLRHYHVRAAAVG